MCRIAGVFEKKFNYLNISDWTKAMADAMHRGGPDDAGLYVSENKSVSFSHRRLSILDLSIVGHQPMYSANKQIVISYNGEIYNFKKIKSKLETEGHTFFTNTDTEVIVAAYQAWGEKSFAYFQGMFAFLLHDANTNTIYAVRDSLGIKPLYIFENQNYIVLSSEIRAIEVLPVSLKENINWESYFLAFGFIPEPETIYENIKMLPKSHFLKINTKLGASNIVEYNVELEKYTPNLDQLHLEINKKLTASVQSHLLSDAPIGVFLSGGIDSSLISIISSKFIKNPLETISLNFDNVIFNESEYQNIIVEKIKSNHTNDVLSFENFEASIADYILSMDQPTSDAINTYFVCRTAKKNSLKVVLSGLGADELFGGYQSFKRAFLISFLHTYIPNFILNIINILPINKLKKSKYLTIKDKIGAYLCNRSIFSPDEICTILGLSKSCLFSKINQVSINNKTKNKNNFDFTAWTETNLYMQNQLLRDSDVMSMWHGIELRVPFVDSSFINFIETIPIKYKNTKLQKKLLINSFSEDLPSKIWNRKKQGFTLPFQTWICKSSMILETLNKNSIYTNFITDFKNGKLHWSRIWVLYLNQIWKEKIKQRTQLY